MRLIGSVLLLLFVVVLSSCKKSQTAECRYGTQFNDTREQIGLMPLNSQWQSFPEKYDMIWWHPTNLDSLKNGTKAFYGGKMIKIKNDTLICEADAFMGPESFIGAKQYVRLSYIYYFVSYEMYPIGWVYSVERQTGEDQRGIIVSCDYITKHEADSILLAWEINKSIF